MARYKPVIINDVQKGSIAEEAGIEKGDILVSIDGEKVYDIFDFRFLTASECLTLEIQKEDGEIWEIDIEKDEDDDLGLEFEHDMIDEAQSCNNKCIFCFIDQLPGGMRDTLYFKDDDSRLSFLTGNYVTLTNVEKSDIDRIIKYRLSPINVSVHTTNPDLRVFMLKNKFAGNVVTLIKRLVDNGITVNCQIVLCRGINDGSELDKTLSDLSAIYPGVGSISVVPVGITRYRDGLCRLEPYDSKSSAHVIRQVEKWQKKLLKKYRTRIVYLADEFYIMAGEKLPGYEEYEDFPQIENGVGLISMLTHEFYRYIEEIKFEPVNDRKVSIATGVSAYNYIREMADELTKRFKININVYEINNEFFGENVTVTGLLTGRDIVNQLQGKELGHELIICECMLKAHEDVFLDDYTLSMLESKLGVRVKVVENSGKAFVDGILNAMK